MIDEKYFDVKITGAKESAVAPDVKKILIDFCNQNEEFERAVQESGKSFSDCIATICKNIGSAISDLCLYEKAVRFYFDGAKIKFNMELDLIGESRIEEKPIEVSKKKMQFSLDDLI